MGRNKRKTAGLLMLFIALIQSILFARLPGDTDPYTRLFRGYIQARVYDAEGNGVSGVRIMANMNIGFGIEERGESAIKFGTTDSRGYVRIVLDIRAPRYWGSPSGHYIEAILTSGPNCTSEISNSEVSSSSSYSIWPVFSVIQDCDGNGINDEFEIQLAKKYSPQINFHNNNPLFPMPPSAVYNSNGFEVITNESGQYYPLPVDNHNPESWKKYFENDLKINLEEKKY